MQLETQNVSSDENPIVAVCRDIARGAGRIETWSALAWEEFSRKYRRASLGIAWAVLSFVIFAVAILFFRAAVAQDGMSERASYVILGFLFFQLLSPMILDASVVFANAANWLKGALVPMSLFVFKSIALNLIVFTFNIIGAGIVLGIFGYTPPSEAWLALPAFLVVVINAVWVYFLLGPLLAKFRDVAQLLAAIMRMAIFVTPILWVPQEGTMLSLVALFNPLTHFIDIMRAPLLGAPTPWLSWYIVGGITLIGWIAAIITFAMTRKKIIFWVI